MNRPCGLLQRDLEEKLKTYVIAVINSPLTPLMWHLSTCHFQYKYSEQRERDIEELQNELGRLREDYLG